MLRPLSWRSNRPKRPAFHPADLKTGVFVLSVKWQIIEVKSLQVLITLETAVERLLFNRSPTHTRAHSTAVSRITAPLP